MKRLWFVLLCLVSAAGAQEYPVFETDKIPPAEYQARRERVKAQIGADGVAVFFTNPERNRNNDVDFLFRADSTFLYLTGFEEPDAALLLVPSGIDVGGRRYTEVLFVNEANQQSLTWLGWRMGSANVPRLLGIESAASNADFEKTLAQVTGSKKVFTGMVPLNGGGRIGTMAAAFEKWRNEGGFGQASSMRGFVNRMREIKSAEEIRLLKKVCEISALAHVEAMRACEPGMREWEIGALVQYIFAKHGCEFPGYPPIVGSGPNSTILHYQSNRRQMKSGDIICMDTAGEYHGYSADVTRSFPVNGKFTQEQREIYNIVLEAQQAGMDLCKPGATAGQIGAACSEKLAAGLTKLGIIKQRNELGRYYMHGFGHGIGLDVHDPMPSTLAPGAVFTIEPGIYIKEGSPCDKKYWNIGVRIEDDILITPTGYVNLSAGCPRKAADIEKLMAEKGIGNVKEAPVKIGSR
jgi:Xaa-Pro aminopeptidase